ncbi:DUF4199 domain-containing protein [Capnocytophaga cynodegmi]|uniref:DUF4199 domain-containing protein n=1 Tax=Capnocytophaga cynodegmi TaxID=28189 RepID=A0A0B7HL23_9FLAO|nr:DUF4199 domain-containing protein [Capnocytophaga cynodegmi]CEN39975.1 conserved membrane hypothetical protein [Capnocytophaga cynodegmi]
METNVVNSKNIMLKNGLYLGLASTALSVAIYATGKTYETGLIFGVITFIISLSIYIYTIRLGIKQFKTENSNLLTIAQALKIGVGIALVGGIIIAIYTYIFTTIIEPEYYEKMTQIQLDKLQEMFPNTDVEEAKRQQGEPSQYITILGSVGGSLFLGLIISLIAGAVMQKKEQTY